MPEHFWTAGVSSIKRAVLSNSCLLLTLEIPLGNSRLTLNAVVLPRTQLSQEIRHHRKCPPIRHRREYGRVRKRRESSKRGSPSLTRNALALDRFLKLPSIASARGRRHRLPPSKRKFVRDVLAASESRRVTDLGSMPFVPPEGYWHSASAPAGADQQQARCYHESPSFFRVRGPSRSVLHSSSRLRAANDPKLASPELASPKLAPALHPNDLPWRPPHDHRIYDRLLSQYRHR